MGIIDFTRGEMSFGRGVDNPTSVVGGRDRERKWRRSGQIGLYFRDRKEFNENSFKKLEGAHGEFPPLFHESLLCLGKLPECFWKFQSVGWLTTLIRGCI